MGTNCASFLSDLILYSYEAEFVQSLLQASKKHLAQQFNFTYRYIDDVLSLKNTKFAEYLEFIFPRELEIKETTETAACSSYLDCYLYIDNGKLTTRLYDKRDDCNFPIVNFPFLSSNIPSAPAYGVYVSQLKKEREKSRECHNHKSQPFPDPKRKRKPTNLNKHKPNKRTKSTKISSLFPKRGNRNTKRTEKHKNKMTHGKTYNKSPRRINHKATKIKTGTTALERSVEQTTGGFKAHLQLANFTLGPDATLNTEIHKNSARIKAPNSVNASKRKHKNQINHYNKQRRVLMANSTVCQSK